MRHICTPNSFDITFGYEGSYYTANSCDGPIQDYGNLATQCDTAPYDNAFFESSNDRIAQFWVEDLTLVDNANLNTRGQSHGCTDSDACNYDEDADIDDGSCFYPDENGECDEDGEGVPDIQHSTPVVGDNFILKWRYKCAGNDFCEAVGADGYEIEFDTGQPKIQQTTITIDSYDPESIYFDFYETFDFGFYGNRFHTTGGNEGIWFIDSTETYSPGTYSFNFSLIYFDGYNEDGSPNVDNTTKVEGGIHLVTESEDLSTRATLNADGSYRSGYSSESTDGYYTIEYNDVTTQLDSGGTLSIYRDPPSDNVPIGTTYIGEFDSNGTITNGSYIKWDGSIGTFNAQLNKCNGSAYECQRDSYPVLPQSFDLRYEHETDGDTHPSDDNFYNCTELDYTLSRVTLNEDGTFSTAVPELSFSEDNSSGPIRTGRAKGRTGFRDRTRDRIRNNRTSSARIKPTIPGEILDGDELEGIGREETTRAYGTYELNLELGTLDLYYIGFQGDDGEITRTIAKSHVEEYPWKYGIARGTHVKYDGSRGTFHTNPLVFERTQVGAYNRIGGSENDDGDYYVTINRYLNDTNWGRQGSMCLHRRPAGAQNRIYCQPVLGSYTGNFTSPSAEDRGIGYNYPSNGVSKHFTWYHDYAFGSCDGCDTVVPDFFGDYNLSTAHMDIQANCFDGGAAEWVVGFGQPYPNDASVLANDPPGVISNTTLSCCVDTHYDYSDIYHGGNTQGCTNPFATNFDCWATEDDGSCIIEGCTDPDADNYNENATIDDGSCVFSGQYMGRIIISEFNSNLGSTAQGGAGDFNFEYVEIYNSLPFAVDISGWTLWGQRWFGYTSTSDNSSAGNVCNGTCEFEDCPETWVYGIFDEGECCLPIADQPMYTFPSGTIMAPNSFKLTVINKDSWKPIPPYPHMWFSSTTNSSFPGQCWDGTNCFPDLYNVYGPGPIDVQEDLDGDGETDFEPGYWYSEPYHKTGINILGTSSNKQITGDEYVQAQLGWPTYFDGTQTMWNQGFNRPGSADCMGYSNPIFEEIENTFQETNNQIYSDCTTNSNNWTIDCWRRTLEADDNRLLGYAQNDLRLNYHGQLCNREYYWDGSFYDFDFTELWVDLGLEVGEVVIQRPNIQSACGAEGGPCEDYTTSQAGCVQSTLNQNYGPDHFCHPQLQNTDGEFCVDGAYIQFDDEPEYNGHGRRLQRCVANWGEDLSKFIVYRETLDGDNADVANLYQWDRTATRTPSLDGVCPEKLWLTDNLGNVVMTMGEGKFRTCSGNTEDTCTEDNLIIGTHMNLDSPNAGTELVIPLDVDWNTFDMNDASNWALTGNSQGGGGLGTIFSFDNGFELDQDIVYGCTDPNANNYNPSANVDDGSCEYDDSDEPILTIYFCDNNGTPYDPCFDCAGNFVNGAGCIWEPDSEIVNENCSEVPLTTQQKLWWLKNYYMTYYDQQISWSSAWENPLYGEYVPYYQADRQCGPRMVQLPAVSFPSICDSWPQCTNDDSCVLCDEAYQIAAGGFNSHASVLLNLGGTCGNCPAGQSCYFSLTESYCVPIVSAQQESLYSNMMRHKDYLVDSVEIMNIINNPKQSVLIEEGGTKIIKDTPDQNPYEVR